ncbi:MAG: hypothetical protein AABY11_03680 [archaeon]
MQGQLDSAQNENDSLRNQVNELQGQLNQQQGSVSELQGRTTHVESELERTIKNPFASAKETTTVTEETNDDVVVQTDSPFTGLASGGAVPAIGLIVLVALVGGFFFLRGRSNGSPRSAMPTENGGAGFFEGNFDALFKGVPNASSGRPELQPKKWSSETEASVRKSLEDDPPERREKINFGEIIKHERD